MSEQFTKVESSETLSILKQLNTIADKKKAELILSLTSQKKNAKVIAEKINTFIQEKENYDIKSFHFNDKTLKTNSFDFDTTTTQNDIQGFYDQITSDGISKEYIENLFDEAIKNLQMDIPIVDKSSLSGDFASANPTRFVISSENGTPEKFIYDVKETLKNPIKLCKI